MTELAESVRSIKKSWQWGVVGGGILLISFAIIRPNLLRARLEPVAAPTISEPLAQYSGTPLTDRDNFLAARSQAISPATVAKSKADAAGERKIIRTSCIEMVVQHPAETADKITALAESVGGYLVSANGSGDHASSGALTIRVPAERFGEAHAAIRKLGLRVESERIEAQDVSRQYVDQDASLRNLKAEETQYLAILKQANTVKDMLAVTERLSGVRGQIEQEQAEFNALSRQIETVAIAISLKTENEERVLGLNWRPLYQLKLALRDGLESLANYATAMMSILFYLPAVLLWVGTILAGIVASWRVARWMGVRWFGWKAGEQAALLK